MMMPRKYEEFRIEQQCKIHMLLIAIDYYEYFMQSKFELQEQVDQKQVQPSLGATYTIPANDLFQIGRASLSICCAKSLSAILETDVEVRLRKAKNFTNELKGERSQLFKRGP